MSANLNKEKIAEILGLNKQSNKPAKENNYCFITYIICKIFDFISILFFILLMAYICRTIFNAVT